ncbi:MAG: hypothetical protein WAO58_00370 [Fimbriimonadaceae bacterium]
MKSFFISAATILCSLAAAQVDLNITIDGKPSGKATYKWSNMANGGVSGMLKMDFELRGMAMSGKVAFTFDKSGRPMAFSTSMRGPGVDETYRLAYGPSHVMVTAIAGGKTESKKVPIPRGKRIASLANLWFLKSKPSPGAADQFWSYTLETGKWELTTIRYVGPKKLRVEGKMVTAYELDESLGTFWLDASGMPYKIRFKVGGMPFVFERSG